MPRRGRPPTPDILTPREWVVLDLLRAGLTNQQIADRLDISLSGAKHHVSEIISKLGVESREEAARWKGRPRLPVFIPALARLGRRGRPRTSFSVATAAGSTVVLIVAVALAAAALTERSTARPELEASAGPTPTQVSEPHRTTIAGYDLGYGAGGGVLVSMVGDVLTVEEQVGAGIVSYVVDTGTRFLWADSERIRFDQSREGLVAGEFVFFGFEVMPAADIDSANSIASMNRIPLDYVVVGYFKYMDGTVLTADGASLELDVNPQLLHAAASIFGSANGRISVVIDPDATFLDLSPRRAGIQVGSTVSISGLVNFHRQAVVHSVSVR